MNKIIAMLRTKTEYDKYLIWLYLLNVSDYLFTLVLLASGLFVEANPLMAVPIQNAYGFGLKCMIPLILLTYLHIRFGASPPRHPKMTRLMLGGILVYYVIINAFHILWLCLLMTHHLGV